MIIVEGCDGTGKSTLVRRICEHFNLEEGVRTARDRDHLFETVKLDTFTALALAVSSPEAIVWDRFFYSELIYARIARNESPRFTLEQAMYCQGVVAALNVPIIICCPPFEQVEKNVLTEDSPQMEGVKSNLRRIYDAYLEVARENGKQCDFIPYDYTDIACWYEVLARVQRYLTWKESLWT